MAKLLKFITHEPANEYHAKSRNGEYMSSHLLADFRESPALYHKKVSGEIAETESTAFAIGRAAHTLILEGRDVLDQEYLISDGPINPKTGEPFGRATKAFAEWAAVQNKQVISCKDFGFISKLQLGVNVHPIASELISEGEAEGVVRAEYQGVPCQIRMDWFNPQKGLIDLKTCESLRWFESDCRKYGYILQLSFYRAVIREVIGQNVPVYIIATEKSEPFACGVWRLTDELLEQAEQVNKSALNRYRNCRLTNSWPTGYEDIRIMDTL